MMTSGSFIELLMASDRPSFFFEVAGRIGVEPI